MKSLETIPIEISSRRRHPAIETSRTAVHSGTHATLAMIAAFTLSGCFTLGPDHAAPIVESPERFGSLDGFETSQDANEVATWWTRFDDPVLDELVRLAVVDNLDLRAAWARINEAQALRGVTAGEQYPAIDVDASSTRNRLSVNNDTPIFSGFPVKQDVNQITVGASWEVDLWGRVKRSVESADADLDARVEDLRDVQVSLIAEVSASYIRLREQQRRLDIARSNLDIQRSTRELVQIRFDTGIGDELALAQAKTNVAQTRAAIPAIEAAARNAAREIAVLLGRRPDQLPDGLDDTGPIPTSPRTFAIGVPADLLRRRPDLRRAEREIAAQSARIGVAIANKYPRVELLGSIGRQSGDLDALFDSGSEIYSLGPSINWPIFAGGALSSQVDAERARLEERRLRYEAAVLVAWREAADAADGFLLEHQRREALTEATGHARNAVTKSEALYREGLVDFQDVLDSQRTLFGVEDDLAISEASIAQQVVALFRALGGGWVPEP